MPSGIRFWRKVVDHDGATRWAATRAGNAECITIDGPLEQLLNPGAHVVEPKE
jgi:hypothetical protein